MKYYGEASFSVAPDLLSGVIVGPVADEGVEILLFVDDGGITVGVRFNSEGYAAALQLLAFYAVKAARSVQLDGLALPEPYKVSVWDCVAFDAHMWFAGSLAVEAQDE
jgi:hypothetical protein